MNDREALAWLGRKICWGFAAGQWEEWEALGPQAVLDRVIEPDRFGIEPRSDPFATIEFDPDNPSESAGMGVAAWIAAAVTTPRPCETFLQFFWSDYFGVSVRTIRPPYLMFRHMNLLGLNALGNFAHLLREITIDPAMLLFLDGDTNTASEPNENYGRELLELYSVGVGNFTEADVKAAARALTGWRVRRIEGRPVFQAARHDPTPQTLLGVDGVNDVYGTIEAVLDHPATAQQVVHKLATAILGDGYPALPVQPIARAFGSDYEIRPVVRALLELALDGAAQPAIVEPVAWYTTVRRFTPASPAGARIREYFRASGQIPLVPPSVGGFPEPSAYLSTSATIARFNFASHLARRSAPDPDAMAQVENIEELATRLGLVNGFAPATRQALEGLDQPLDRMAAALASPDLVVV